MSAYEDLVSSIRSTCEREKMSVRALALRANMPVRSVQSVIDGHVPSITRAEEICDALGLELYIGPPRSGAAEVSDAPGGSAFLPVSDRRLAGMLATLADEYEAMNPRGRDALATRFDIAFPELGRAKVGEPARFSDGG